jgi:hypothetical protein
VTRPGAHPNAVNRAKAKAKRAVPTAAVATAGAVAIIDPVTGQLAPATPAEIGALSQAARTGGVTPLAARPDVQVVRLADGTLVATVPPELMMHAYAKVGADGKVTFTCGDERVAAPAAPAAPAAAPWEAK